MENGKRSHKQPEKATKSENLGKVSGGYVLYYDYALPTPQWEVIRDDDGETLGAYKTFKEAREAAEQKGQSKEIVPWEAVDSLRKNK